MRDKAALIADLGVHREQVVDARAAGRFEGTAPETWPGRRQGHIPGSRNLPFDRVTDPQTRRLRSAEELQALFDEAGVRLDRPIVTSCGSGVTACAVAFAAHLLGHPGAAVYDGSWSEWGLPDGPPIETGPARDAVRDGDPAISRCGRERGRRAVGGLRLDPALEPAFRRYRPAARFGPRRDPGGNAGETA